MFDQRFLKVAIVVLLLHAGLLYLIQTGLGRKLTEAVVGPEIIARIIPMELPQQPPAPEPPTPQPTPPRQARVVTPHPNPNPPKPQPTPTAVASLPPLPNAIEAPPPPPAAPAPALEPPAPAAPAAAANAAPRAVGIGEIACSSPQVTYPAQSRRTGETGKTIVRLTTDENGRVVKAAVVSSSGSTRLDTAAVNAVQAMRCKPYMENGRGVAVTAQQPVTFELD
ncbi:energy transducer TonB [Cupriavidus sp. 2TAF22]|uniref:energy transducer TonB n=1 Tax=unclassified Cupriavidus TaxID=2640874 RepID=UPI003F93712D